MQVTSGTGQLRQELEQAVASIFGSRRLVRHVSRRRSQYSSSYTIHNLRVVLDRGERFSLVLKDLSPSALLEEARGVRPGFLYDPLREIEMYRTVIEQERFKTPIFYGAVIQKEIDRYWLFLERVEGPLLWQVGGLEQWMNAARWLACFHGHFAIRKSNKLALPKLLLRYDVEHCMRWLSRAERFVTRRRSSVPTQLALQFNRIAKGYSRIVDNLLTLPRSLVHGEFYPSNVILRRHRSGGTVCPIDWEVAAVGPGMIDLAALVSGAWEPSDRKALIAAYREELGRITTGVPSMRELLESVDYCALYLSVQWLGWAENWSPPASHERDWLREAIRLGKRLGL
jgi:hypothetical protein